MATVRSLREAALAASRKTPVARFVLSRSEDLVCKNMMCEKVGSACVCKLSRFMEQTPLEGLQELDLSANNLDIIPSAVFSGARDVQTLLLAKNSISTLPDEIASLQDLRTLDLRDNPMLTHLPMDSLVSLKHLQTLYLGGCPADIQELRKALPGCNVEA